jgi:hypothetical protein
MGVSTLNSHREVTRYLSLYYALHIYISMFISLYLHGKNHKNIFCFYVLEGPMYSVPWQHNIYIYNCIHMFLHLASLFHIKIHKNTWAHEGPHISEKKPKKKWAHEGSQHNPRICSFGYVRD